MLSIREDVQVSDTTKLRKGLKARTKKLLIINY